MSFREVPVHEVREVLRLWLSGKGYRAIARMARLDPKTVRRYVEGALEFGLRAEDGPEQLTDELVGLVCQAVRPVRTEGHGAAWAALEPHEQLIRDWLDRQGEPPPHQGAHAPRPPRRGRPLPHPAPLRQRVLRLREAPGDRARRRRRARRRTAGRLRADGPRPRPFHRPPAGHPRPHLHRLLQPPHVRVAQLPPDDRGGDRGLRGRMGLLLT